MPGLCDRLFFIITLINSGHAYLFNKFLFVVFFSDNEYNAVKLPHSAHRKHAFLVKMKEKSKSKNQVPNKKVYLELLHQILVHRSTRSLMAGYNVNVWQYIELRVDTDPLCTSCQISAMPIICSVSSQW